MSATTEQGWNGVTSTFIEGNSVSDGAKIFGLNAEGPINMVEWLTFTPAATGGTVTVQTSPDGGLTWDDMATGGVIVAASSGDPARTKPQGRGKATVIRFVMAGITGATSFKAEVTQGVY
jgi:hypothetical protein